jgi:hypothetical protein
MVAIKTYVIPDSLKKPKRIVANAGKGRRVIISYPDDYNGEFAHFQAVKKLCAKMDWHGNFICGGFEDGSYVFVYKNNAEIFSY